MKTKKFKIKTVDVIAKEWFDKTYAECYFSMNVTINYGMKTQQSFFVPIQSGYRDDYKDIAFEALQTKGLIPEQANNVAPWHYYKDNEIIARHTKHLNCLKRELNY